MNCSCMGATARMTFVRTAYVEPVYPRVVDYDCQGVHLKAEYGQNVVRLSWPNGGETLRRHEGPAGEIRYESEHSELRVGHDILWGREGGLPRILREVRYALAIHPLRS